MQGDNSWFLVSRNEEKARLSEAVEMCAKSPGTPLFLCAVESGSLKMINGVLDGMKNLFHVEEVRSSRDSEEEGPSGESPEQGWGSCGYRFYLLWRYTRCTCDSFLMHRAPRFCTSFMTSGLKYHLCLIVVYVVPPRFAGRCFVEMEATP